MFKFLLTVPVISTFYSIWPVAITLTGTNAIWGGFLAMASTAVVVLSWGMITGGVSATPSAAAIMIMIGVGVLNGIGIIMHASAMTNPTITKIFFQSALAVTMVLFSGLVAWIALREPINAKQLFWLAGATACVLMATIQK